MTKQYVIHSSTLTIACFTEMNAAAVIHVLLAVLCTVALARPESDEYSSIFSQLADEHRSDSRLTSLKLEIAEDKPHHARLADASSECPTGCNSGNMVTECVCTNCTKGTYGTTGTSCPSCAAGTFTNYTAQTACMSCVAGTYSMSGASMCSDCPIGMSSSASAPSCTACPSGSITVVAGSGLPVRPNDRS